MKILALETSTEACSVALAQGAAVIERIEFGTRHSELILGMVQEVLAESGLSLSRLDAIAFGRGPGSFTSLRIGAGVAQGLAYGAGIPVVPVSTLATLAQDTAADKALAALDARMRQVYWGAYVRNAQGMMQPVGEERVAAPPDVPLPEGEGWIGSGSGWDQYHVALQERLGTHLAQWHAGCHPHARTVAVLGAAAFKAGMALPPDQALPVYLRDEVAVKARTVR